ncbi:MAG TPA: universal stress protein [Acidimicrobiales bacterium]|nr:universal stress protein [Acidimicrobiales bacterium]
MKAPRTLVVGYDGSLDAEDAVRWTFHLANETNANVTVVHAAGMLEHLNAHYASDEIPLALVDIATQCDFDVARLRWLVQDGDACSVLLRTTAPPINADLLVVGSRGHGKRAGLLLGSTSLEVVEHSSTPVVVVPSSHAVSL